MLFLLTSCITKAQISTCAYHDGYWGEWISHTFRYGYGIPDKEQFKLYGNYSGFIIYQATDHPSEYIFKFNADSYSTPDKKTIKYHLKNNLWYVYTGTVEYYVTESYPTITSILKAYDFTYFNCNSGSAGNPCAKRTARATIKIAPYKKRPKCYAIYFDNVGIGIDLENCYFKQ